MLTVTRFLQHLFYIKTEKERDTIQYGVDNGGSRCTAARTQPQYLSPSKNFLKQNC